MHTVCHLFFCMLVPPSGFLLEAFKAFWKNSENSYAQRLTVGGQIIWVSEGL